MSTRFVGGVQAWREEDSQSAATFVHRKFYQLADLYGTRKYRWYNTNAIFVNVRNYERRGFVGRNSSEK